MEEGGWKLLLVIRIENYQKIKLNKNRSIFVLNGFENFPLPSSSFKPASIKYSYPELKLNTWISFRVSADISGGAAKASRAVHIDITFCNYRGCTAADFL